MKNPATLELGFKALFFSHFHMMAILKGRKILILFILAPLYTFAQKGSFTIAGGYGAYVAPKIPKTYIAADSNKSVSKDYYSANFSYHLTDRISITSGFLGGKFNYYDDTRSNAWDEHTKYKTSTTNARGYDFHTFLMANVSLLSKKKHIQIQLGTGIGFSTQRLKYPYREPCSSGCMVFIGETSKTSVEVPVNVKVYYMLSKNLGLGLTAGGFINDEPKLIGLHGGPEFRLNL